MGKGKISDDALSLLITPKNKETADRRHSKLAFIVQLIQLFSANRNVSTNGWRLAVDGLALANLFLHFHSPRMH